MGEDDNIKFMRRCLDLANKARGMTYPNPLVGSVIVCDGQIIGEGFHLKAGMPHAEAVAIGTVTDKSMLRNSTLYVNLEPCSHFGNTPPCADLIVSTGIRKVVIGTQDTNEKVSGKGISRLKSAGCEVITGILEKECRWINRRFFTFMEAGRPYIILKWAQSADGFIDVKRDEWHGQRPAWITGNAERVLVHKWRAEEQSILAGAGTIRADNPSLNVREWSGNDPVRVIVSGSGLIDRESKIFRTNGTNIVFTGNADAKFDRASVVILNKEEETVKQITDHLFVSGVQSLLVEGGSGILSQFIRTGLWDEARIFHGTMSFKEGIRAPGIKGRIDEKIILGSSTLEILLNEAGRFSRTIDNSN